MKQRDANINIHKDKEMNNLLSISETASYLRVSKSTLYRWVYKKQIQHVKIGSRVLFLESYLLEFLEENTIQPRGA